MSRPQPEDLGQRARALELDIATVRLSQHLFPDVRPTAGRCRFLTNAIVDQPRLVAGLLDGKTAVVDRYWPSVLAEQKSNVRFLHGLAVLHREQALATLAASHSNGQHCRISAALWCVLLGSSEFWDYFERDRFHCREGSDRVGASPAAALLEAGVTAALGTHIAEAARHAAARNYGRARVHFDCLDVGRRDAAGLVRVLQDAGLPCQLTPDDERATTVSRLADKLLDDWSATLVGEAKKIVEDPDAIARLPQGLRKNYEGGVRHLEPFIALEIPVKRVLCASLEWFNDWCYDLYVAAGSDSARMRDTLDPVLRRARVAAAQLAPRCIKGLGHLLENRALSQHFMLLGFVSDKPDRGQAEYEAALAWNDRNINAEQLLGDAAQQVFMQQLDTAIEQAEQGQFEAAYGIVRNVGERAKDTARVQQAHVVICFKHATSLAEQGHYRAALERASEARRLEPHHPAVRQLHDELKGLAPEEDNLRNLKMAEAAIEKERYTDALTAAARVTPDSKFLARARNLQSGAHFHRGLEHAKQEQFDSAVGDMQRALQLNDNEAERQIITQQLAVLVEARIGHAVKTAVDRKDYAGAATILRNALNEGVAAAARETVRTQLSAVLNAHAVELVNESQEIEKVFSDAMLDIINRVKQRQAVGQYY